MRICNACEEEKPLELFYRDKRDSEGRQRRCKSCQSERARVYYERNKEDYKRRYERDAERQRMLAAIRRYGITEEQYYNLPNECEVCGSDKNLAIDHCHKTGKVRGRLCNNCNTALGLLKDNVEVIESLKRYITPD